MQVKNSGDTLDFAYKFRNYSKEDGHEYKILDDKKYSLRRKNKIYCPNCKTQNKISDIYCKECGTCLESINKKTYDFSIKNILSNINVKDSIKIAGFATVILFFISIVIKQVLAGVLGSYMSYVSSIDILLLLNGGKLSLITGSNYQMGYSNSNYYNFSIQICSLVLLILPIIALILANKIFVKDKHDNELKIITKAVGVGITYGIILAIFAVLSKSQLSVGGGYLSSGYNIIYSISVLSVVFRGFLLGLLSTLYISITKQNESNNMYLDVFKQVVKTIALGYTIVFVLLSIGYLIGLSYVYEFSISNSISSINIFVVIAQLAAYIWGFANFNLTTIGSQTLFLPNLFKTSLSVEFKLCLIAFIALSTLILLISGVKLNTKYKDGKIKIIVIFSAFYAIIMGLLSLFTCVNVNGGSFLGYNITMNMSIILAIIMSFFYSFIISFIGFKLNDWD